MSDDDLPPLVVGPDGPDGDVTAPSLEARRGRTTRRVLTAGAGVATLGAVAVGVVTRSGRSSLAALFTGLALASAVAAVVTLVAAVRDEFRGVRVRRGRVAGGLAMLVAAPLLLVLAAGAGGAA